MRRRRHEGRGLNGHPTDRGQRREPLVLKAQAVRPDPSARYGAAQMRSAVRRSVEARAVIGQTTDPDR